MYFSDNLINLSNLKVLDLRHNKLKEVCREWPDQTSLRECMRVVSHAILVAVLNAFPTLSCILFKLKPWLEPVA